MMCDNTIKVTIELTEKELESLANACELVYDKRMENYYENGLNEEDDKASKVISKIYLKAYEISKMHLSII